MARGNPDYTIVNRAQKPTFADDQVVWTWFGVVPVPGLANVTVPVFVVPAGLRNLISSGQISCDIPGLQTGDYIYDGVTIMTVCFNTNWQLIDSDIGAAYFIPGDTLALTFYNNQAGAANFYYSVWGTIESYG